MRPRWTYGITALAGVAATLAASSGCAVGLGVVDVGTTRTSTTSIADTTGEAYQIGDTTIVTSQTGPSREISESGAEGHFGVMVGVHAGTNRTRFGAQTGAGWAGEAFVEALGGKGRWAIGGRVGYMIRRAALEDRDGDGKRDASTAYGGLPMTVHAYYGISERVSTHVGIGGDVIPFGPTRALRLMTGLRYALPAREGVTMFVVDVDHLRSPHPDGPYRSLGVIGGLAFVR